MSDSYVCSGATLKCSMGTSQAKLTVSSSRTVFLTGQPMANISDHLSMANLAPFGKCRSMGFPATASATAANHGTLTPMPCMHNTPFPWMGGKNDYKVKDDDALLKSSTCSCMWGGTISIINDGQVYTGSADLSKIELEEFENQKQSRLLDVTKKSMVDAQINDNIPNFEFNSNAKNNPFSMGEEPSPKLNKSVEISVPPSKPKYYSADSRTYADTDSHSHLGKRLDVNS